MLAHPCWLGAGHGAGNVESLSSPGSPARGPQQRLQAQQAGAAPPEKWTVDPGGDAAAHRAHQQGERDMGCSACWAAVRLQRARS